MIKFSSTVIEDKMLHRSFNPAKCKTALKLAVSRINLLKHKREAQIRQLKRELAQLLESGHEQTARIRVEHVVTEEQTMAAYDLLEIYCKLILARLPIIESQKNCPIGLREAITSIIFASPRCADIPELLDVHNHFTVIYGKEFISSAVELRPDCGVSRTLVEKLSSKAPDIQTKIKILSAIAEEQNIKWDDPNSFGEKRSKASGGIADIGADRMVRSGTSHPEERPSGTGVDQENIQTDTKQTHCYDKAAVVFNESSSEDDDWFDAQSELSVQESDLYFTSSGRQSPIHLLVNMNTWSSRQITSESLGSIQHSHFSTEGHAPPEFSESLSKSAVPLHPDGFLPVTFDDSSGPRSESEEEMDKSKLRGTTNPSKFSRTKNVCSGNPEPTQSANQWLTGSSYTEDRNSGSNRKPWLHSSSDESDSMEVHPENQGTEFNAESQKKSAFGLSSNHQPSPRLTKSRIDLNDMNSKSLYSAFDEGKPLQSMKSSRCSLLHEVKDNVRATESPDTMKDTEFLNQSSLESSKELNLGMLTGGLRNKGFRVPPYTRSPSSDALSSSEQATKNTFTRFEQSTASPSVKTSISSGAYNQKVSTKVDKKSSSRAQATYLDSDSDMTGEELPRPNFRSNQEPSDQKAGIKVTNKISRSPTTYFDSGNGDSEEDFPKQNLTSKGHPVSGFSRRTKPSPSHAAKSSYSKVAVASEELVTPDHSTKRQPSRNSYATETLPMAQFLTTSSGHRESSDNGDSVEDLPNQTLTSKGRLSIHNGFSRRTKSSPSHSEKSYNSNVVVASEVSVTPDHSTERKPSRNSYATDATETLPMAQSQTMSSGHWGSSDNVDSKKDLPNWTLTSNGCLGRGISRRTKAPPPYSEKSSYSKVTVASEVSVTSDHGSEGRPSRSSGDWESPEQPRSVEKASSNPMPESKITLREESLRASAIEQPSSPLPKMAASFSTSSSSRDIPSRENSLKKASHVHPKLPDYDTLTAHLESLKLNRK